MTVFLLILVLLSGEAFAENRDPSDPGPVRISEIMPDNKAFLANDDGIFRDWIELFNASEETVCLNGYGLSDKPSGAKWFFPDVEIAPGDYLVVFASHDPCEGLLCADFGISSKGETVFLYDPEGNTVSLIRCGKAPEDVSYGADDEGNVSALDFPTPGFPNTKEGYAAYCRTLSCGSPVIINEAESANCSFLCKGNKTCDWVELKNISDSAADLSEYVLTDYSEYGPSGAAAGNRKGHAFRLPERELAPGEMILLFCTDDLEDECCTGFGLDSAYDSLYLFHEEKLADYASLRGIPVDGSMGRMNDLPSFWYFPEPSPLSENDSGYRFVSEAPSASVPEGVFSSGGFSVELSGKENSKIYYTLDGSIPGPESQEYTEPLEMKETAILRAICVEKDSTPSETATFSYIIDTCSLPVVSLVIDDIAGFRNVYTFISNMALQMKEKEFRANISFFDGERTFSIPCGVHMRGYTSLNAAKKSMAVYFRDKYGADTLNFDVFENGIDEYSSLCLRVGQDYNFTYIRNELFQELCMEMTDNVPTQESQYCVLYVNGEYWGLHCLKEDFSSQYYSSHYKISKDSVIRQNSPIPYEADFYQEVYKYTREHDLSQKECYDYICSVLDIDNLIDWIILEGVSGNTDTVHNFAVFRSEELDNKWRIAFYDLDWALWYEGLDFENMFSGAGNANFDMTLLIRGLSGNEEFKERFLNRFLEVNTTVLSNEHILEKIDELTAEIEEEVPRDLVRWTEHSLLNWTTLVQNMKDMIVNYNWAAHNREVITWHMSGAREFFAEHPNE